MKTVDAGTVNTGATGSGDGHWRRIIVIWAVLSAAIDPLFWFFVGNKIPPGNSAISTTANGATFDAKVLSVTAIPVALAVLVYYAYALVVWHEPKGAPLSDGPPLRGHAGIQFTWLAVTTAIVLWVFGFGTFELVQPDGAGGAQGPNPIWTPASHTVLPVQVIGQQWYWTFRYPTFGGFETSDLVIPDHTSVAFHVTSLDVIHDFWAYQLGVKADANPAVDNIAYTTTSKTGSFIVRCDELCGIWHGAMYTTGTVVPKSAFEQWAKTTEVKEASLSKTLPKFSYVYVPSANPAAAFAADGSAYPDISPALSPSANCPVSGGVDSFSKQEIAPYQGDGPKSC